LAKFEGIDRLDTISVNHNDVSARVFEPNGDSFSSGAENVQLLVEDEVHDKELGKAVPKQHYGACDGTSDNY
jgi:hypothetical protein